MPSDSPPATGPERQRRPAAPLPPVPAPHAPLQLLRAPAPALLTSAASRPPPSPWLTPLIRPQPPSPSHHPLHPGSWEPSLPRAPSQGPSHPFSQRGTRDPERPCSLCGPGPPGRPSSSPLTPRVGSPSLPTSTCPSAAGAALPCPPPPPRTTPPPPQAGAPPPLPTPLQAGVPPPSSPASHQDPPPAPTACGSGPCPEVPPLRSPGHLLPFSDSVGAACGLRSRLQRHLRALEPESQKTVCALGLRSPGVSQALCAEATVGFAGLPEAPGG